MIQLNCEDNKREGRRVGRTYKRGGWRGEIPEWILLIHVVLNELKEIPAED